MISKIVGFIILMFLFFGCSCSDAKTERTVVVDRIVKDAGVQDAQPTDAIRMVDADRTPTTEKVTP